MSSAMLPPNRTVTSTTSRDAMELHLAQADLAVELLDVGVGPRPVDAPPLERHILDLGLGLAGGFLDRFRLGQAGQRRRPRRSPTIERITNGQLSMTSAIRSA